MAEFTTDDALQFLVGPKFSLARVDPTTTPGFTGGDKKLAEAFEAPDAELLELQKKLYATARVSPEKARSVLVVLQGMDTSGKGGVIRHVFGLFPPLGLQVSTFGRPTGEELEHDFLWRFHPRTPDPGFIAVWDRSHYEDVLVHRVHQLSPAEEIERRYGAISDFEWGLSQQGVTIIKVMLHISREFQAENLKDRLRKTEKMWKYDPSDIDDRALWDEHQEAFEIALQRTSTPFAPWYCIPGDDKSFARMVVKYLMLDALREMDLEWPELSYDPETELARLAES